MTEDLERRLALLEGEVAALRAMKTGTMKQAICCPACGGRRIMHFTQVTERGNPNIGKLALAHTRSWRGINDLAPLEAYACRACGKVEWWAKNLEDVEVDGEIVRLLDSEPEAPDAGPYR